MILFSVIIPVYNRRKYICRCLNSVIRQSCLDYEIIIVDDGSYDGTGKICDEYSKKYKKIKVIHTENNGVSDARNVGIKNSKGKFALFIDSDDYIHPNYLQKIKETYEKYGIEFFYCTSFEIHSVHGVQYIQYRKNNVTLLKSSDFFELMNQGLFYSVCNKVFEMSILKKYNIQFPNTIDLGEDLLFNLCYLDKKDEIKFITLNNNFYNIQETRGSLERGWRENYFKIQQKLLKEKIRYLNRWIDNGKIYSNGERNIFTWYYNCINESIRYYVEHAANMNILMIIRKINEIKCSPEYLKYIKLNNEKKVMINKMIWDALCCRIKVKGEQILKRKISVYKCL